MRGLVFVLLPLALAACEPGPVFTDQTALDAARADREAELRGGTTTLSLPQGGSTLPGSGPIGASELAAAGIGGGSLAPPPVATAPLGMDPVYPSAPGAAVAPVPNAGGISDEQSFEAVSNRETIQSDAERLAAQRSAYQVIPPEPLGERPRDSGPNIVAYALQTTNRVGEQIYSRSSINLGIGGQRGCGSYSSPDKAQEAFLEGGGPRRDRYGLDPDGDGFACAWDPAPFRTVRAN